MKKVFKVSVSLRSIIHSYICITKGGYIHRISNKFPSPYGVSFILIKEYRYKDTSLYIVMFPSPYGVSFILI